MNHQKLLEELREKVGGSPSPRLIAAAIEAEEAWIEFDRIRNYYRDRWCALNLILQTMIEQERRDQIRRQVLDEIKTEISEVANHE